MSQHRNVGKFLSLCFFVLYYKTNIKHFFRVDIQLYQHSWKLGKLEIVLKHSALRASCFHAQFVVFPISTRVDITVYQHGNVLYLFNTQPCIDLIPRLCKDISGQKHRNRRPLHQNRSAAGSIPARDLKLHFSQLFLVRSNKCKMYINSHW
jgi:hypothetical protein